MVSSETALRIGGRAPSKYRVHRLLRNKVRGSSSFGFFGEGRSSSLDVGFLFLSSFLLF